jgi:outer membrane protein assembly factor BamB
MSTKLTRRRFLAAVSAGATWIALTGVQGCKTAERASKDTQSTTASPTQPGHVLAHDSSSAPPEGEWVFRTRTELNPPAVEVTTPAHETASGYVLAAPNKSGVAIFDNSGEVVWFRPLHNPMDFKVQHYRGRPVLTWEDHVVGGEQGYVIIDDSYREIARVRAGNGYRGDHHEFLITPEDTALITIFDAVPRDLSSVGGPKDGKVRQGIVQELDIETGEVLFEWHSLDHVELDETYVRRLHGDRLGWDYFHINSIDVDHDGNLLVSSRYTFAVYKIDRNSGEIIWRLGGKKSDFEMGPGTQFSYQHDARRQQDGTITIFDNGDTIFKDSGGPQAVEESRGIVLELDEERMRASLVRQYTHPDEQYAHASGNMQVLPNGNVFIGWGRAHVFSESSKDGELLFSASLPPLIGTYRAFRFPWSGYPKDRPAVVAKRVSEDEVSVYASWNGATEVATWEVLAGLRPGQLESLGSVPRDGFETAILARTSRPYVTVRAKDSSGRVLGASKPIRPES